MNFREANEPLLVSFLHLGFLESKTVVSHFDGPHMADGYILCLVSAPHNHDDDDVSLCSTHMRFNGFVLLWFEVK